MVLNSHSVQRYNSVDFFVNLMVLNNTNSWMARGTEYLSKFDAKIYTNLTNIRDISTIKLALEGWAQIPHCDMVQNPPPHTPMRTYKTTPMLSSYPTSLAFQVQFCMVPGLLSE